MSINWTAYRLLCCMPPDLEQERQVFHAANTRFAEEVTMPAWILFGLASPRPDSDPRVSRSALESNIRFCDFFVQIFGETMPDPLFPAFVDLAINCTADPNFPMRSTVVLFRNPENASPEMASLRQRLIESGGCSVRDFHNAEELDAVAGEILTGWFRMIQPLKNASAVLESA